MESGVIEKQTDTFHPARAGGGGNEPPFVLGEKIERALTNAEEAASDCLKWDLHLPGDLDSWKVVE